MALSFELSLVAHTSLLCHAGPRSAPLRLAASPLLYRDRILEHHGVADLERAENRAICETACDGDRAGCSRQRHGCCLRYDSQWGRGTEGGVVGVHKAQHAAECRVVVAIGLQAAPIELVPASAAGHVGTAAVLHDQVRALRTTLDVVPLPPGFVLHAEGQHVGHNGTRG